MKPAIYVLPDDHFYRNLGYLRKKYGLSQRALGRLLHVGAVVIKMMEENRWGETVHLEMLTRVAQIFNVNVNDLVTTELSKK